MLWITTDVFLDQHKPCQRKLGIFFPGFFAPILCVINNGICHLWLLLSDYQPTVSLSWLSLLVCTFLFYFTSKLFLIEPSLPWNFSSHVGEYFQFTAVLCHMISINPISQRVCILLKGDVNVNEVRSSRMCGVWSTAFISGLKMGMSLNELSKYFPHTSDLLCNFILIALMLSTQQM